MHETSETTILACCDQELIGKTLEDGEISFTVKESFYKGEIISAEQFLVLWEQANTANLIGRKSVDCALRNGFASEKDIRLINGIPHLQLYRL